MHYMGDEIVSPLVNYTDDYDQGAWMVTYNQPG